MASNPTAVLPRSYRWTLEIPGVDPMTVRKVKPGGVEDEGIERPLPTGNTVFLTGKHKNKSITFSTDDPLAASTLQGLYESRLMIDGAFVQQNDLGVPVQTITFYQAVIADMDLEERDLESAGSVPKVDVELRPSVYVIT